MCRRDELRRAKTSWSYRILRAKFTSPVIAAQPVETLAAAPLTDSVDRPVMVRLDAATPVARIPALITRSPVRTDNHSVNGVETMINAGIEERKSRGFIRCPTKDIAGKDDWRGDQVGLARGSLFMSGSDVWEDLGTNDAVRAAEVIAH